MLYVCVGGLLLALAVFLLINRLGMLLVDKVYMSDDAVKQRKNEIYSDFSAYVKANSVSGRDSLSVAKWTDGQPYVTVVIFGRGADHRRFHDGKTEQETEYAAAMTIITTARSISSALRTALSGRDLRYFRYSAARHSARFFSFSRLSSLLFFCTCGTPGG